MPTIRANVCPLEPQIQPAVVIKSVLSAQHTSKYGDLLSNPDVRDFKAEEKNECKTINSMRLHMRKNKFDCTSFGSNFSGPFFLRSLSFRKYFAGLFLPTVNL